MSKYTTRMYPTIFGGSQHKRVHKMQCTCPIRNKTGWCPPHHLAITSQTRLTDSATNINQYRRSPTEGDPPRVREATSSAGNTGGLVSQEQRERHEKTVVRDVASTRSRWPSGFSESRSVNIYPWRMSYVKAVPRGPSTRSAMQEKRVLRHMYVCMFTNIYVCSTCDIKATQPMKKRIPCDQETMGHTT